MTKTEAETERVRLLSVQVLPPGFPPLSSYASVSVRMKPTDLRHAEVVGERRITRSVVRTVKTPGQPDTLTTTSETISVFDTLAH